MIVVSDTSPIISLLKIGRLDLLRELYSEVIVPEAVYSELTLNAKYATEAAEVKACSFVTMVEVLNHDAVDALRRTTGLHLGESEAVVLARQLGADLLLLDEAAGRSVAQSMDLEYTGTLGILAAAYGNGLLDGNEINSCIEALREHGRHISDELYAWLVGSIEASSDGNANNVEPSAGNV